MIGIANRCIADLKLDERRSDGRDADEIAGVEDDFAGTLAARADVRAGLALRYGADLSARERPTTA